MIGWLANLFERHPTSTKDIEPMQHMFIGSACSGGGASTEEDKTYQTETRAMLERMAAELEPEIATQQAARLERFRKDLARDKRAFQFECRRWGDFLSLHVARTSAAGHEVRASHTINLAAASPITLMDGMRPNLNGRVLFTWDIERPPSASGTFWIHTEGGQRLPRLEPGARFKVAYQQPELSPQSPAPFGDEPRTAYQYYGSYSQVIKRNVSSAQPAVDDRIAFGKDTLSVPHGKGAEVYNAILAELERGAPKVVRVPA